MKKNRVLVALLMVFALVAASCSGTDSNAGGDAEETETTEVEESEPEEAETAGADPFATVGPADDSLEPIRVGFMSFVAIPDVTTGFELGANWVNEELGGVGGSAGGAPIEVSTCPVDFTPEASINCANQFIEEGVVAVLSLIHI